MTALYITAQKLLYHTFYDFAISNIDKIYNLPKKALYYVVLMISSIFTNFSVDYYAICHSAIL